MGRTQYLFEALVLKFIESIRRQGAEVADFLHILLLLFKELTLLRLHLLQALLIILNSLGKVLLLHSLRLQLGFKSPLILHQCG